MTHISKFVYALIIFLSLYLVVTDGMRTSFMKCKDDFDCLENVLELGGKSFWLASGPEAVRLRKARGRRRLSGVKKPKWFPSIVERYLILNT